MRSSETLLLTSFTPCSPCSKMYLEMHGGSVCFTPGALTPGCENILQILPLRKRSWWCWLYMIKTWVKCRRKSFYELRQPGCCGGGRKLCINERQSQGWELIDSLTQGIMSKWGELFRDDRRGNVATHLSFFVLIYTLKYVWDEEAHSKTVLETQSIN